MPAVVVIHLPPALGLLLLGRNYNPLPGLSCFRIVALLFGSIVFAVAVFIGCCGSFILPAVPAPLRASNRV